jgi:protein-S-isoprenylcysteine O-methyltransferase Ste14
MYKDIHKIIQRAVDGALYGFIGPFSVLYIIPRFLMNISNTKSLAGFGIVGVKIAGFIIIWLGAALAIWCTILMFLFGKGTPLVTSAPKKILDHNIYGYVRHPMMWSLIFVVLGQALMYGQIILLLWLIALSRILHLIVANYEEPQLECRFGESWKKYCREVPRWFPRL